MPRLFCVLRGTPIRRIGVLGVLEKEFEGELD
jgi:hypothetical protein